MSKKHSLVPLTIGLILIASMLGFLIVDFYKNEKILLESNPDSKYYNPSLAIVDFSTENDPIRVINYELYTNVKIKVLDVQTNLDCEVYSPIVPIKLYNQFTIALRVIENYTSQYQVNITFDIGRLYLNQDNKINDTFVRNNQTLVFEKFIPTKTTTKISQQQADYLESFDELWQSRYKIQNSDGDNSSWVITNSNSLYSIKKDEDNYNNDDAIPYGGSYVYPVRKKTSDQLECLNCGDNNIRDPNYKINSLNSDEGTYYATDNDDFIVENTYVWETEEQEYADNDASEQIQVSYLYQTTPDRYGILRGLLRINIDDIENKADKKIISANLTVYYNEGSGSDDILYLYGWTTTVTPYSEESPYGDAYLAYVGDLSGNNNQHTYNAEGMGDPIVFNVIIQVQEWFDYSSSIDYIGWQFRTYSPSEGVEPFYHLYDAQAGSGTRAKLHIVYEGKDYIEPEYEPTILNNTEIIQGSVTNNNITWVYTTYYGANETNYTIYANDTIVQTGNWTSGTNITLSDDWTDWPVGTYNITIIVCTDQGCESSWIIITITALVYVADPCYYSITTNLEPVNDFYASFDWTFDVRSTLGMAKYEPNTLDFQLGTGDAEDSPFDLQSFFRMRVKDNQTGGLWIEWQRTDNTTASYYSGYNIAHLQSYKFTIDFKKDDDIKYSVLKNGDQYIRPTSWKSLVSDVVSNRPKITSLGTIDPGVSSTKPKQGYLMTFNFSSSVSPTGNATISLDKWYSSTGLVDAGMRERTSGGPEGNIYDRNPYGILYQADSVGNAFVYNRAIVRDFRSFTGLMGFLQPIRNDTNGLKKIEITIYIRFFEVDGSVNANSMEAHILISAGEMYLIISDNATYTRNFYTISASGDPIELETGFGIFIQDRSETENMTVIMSSKTWDSKNSKLEVHPVFGTYPSSTVTTDAQLDINYNIDSLAADLDSQASLSITDSIILNGPYLTFSEQYDSIPVPKEIWIKPNRGLFETLFRDLSNNPVGTLFGAVAGTWDALIGGITDVFSLLGDLYDYVIDISGWIDDIFGYIIDLYNFIVDTIDTVLDSILSGIDDLIAWTIALINDLTDAIFDFLETWIIPFIQVNIAEAIFDWILAELGLTETFEETGGFFDFIVTLIVLIWLALLFCMFSLPFFMAIHNRYDDGSNLLSWFWRIWSYDCTMGADIPVIGHYPAPLCLLMILATIIIAPTQGVTYFDLFFPWR